MNDTEFKTIATEMIEKHTIFRDHEYDNIIEEASDTIDRLNTIILHARRYKGRKPQSYLKTTGMVDEVESVMDRLERLYRHASNIEKEHHLLYELSEKIEDIDIEEHSN